jgi:hypothetical protein
MRRNQKAYQNEIARRARKIEDEIEAQNRKTKNILGIVYVFAWIGLLVLIALHQKQMF